jgi:hypothetical protein
MKKLPDHVNSCGSRIDEMNNFRDALIVGLCVFDIRMGEDGFEADSPCATPCEYCSQQADFLLSLLKDLEHDQQPVENDRRED